MLLRLLQRLFDRDAKTCATHEPAHGDVPARDVSFGQLAAAVRALSVHIAAHIGPGDVLMLSAPNCPEFSASFLAGLGAGIRVFPVSPELTATELRSAAEQAGAIGVIGTAAVLEALAGNVRHAIKIDDVLRLPTVQEVQGDSSHAGLLLQSSGTMGRPKIVFRDAASLDAVAQQMAEAIGFRPYDRVLACVPLCHSYGIEHGLLAPTWAGSAVHLCRGFDLRVARRELATGGVTLLPGVPFMYEMLAQHAGDATFPTLRRAYSAGGPLPRAIQDAVHDRYGVRVSQLYGATEIGSVTFADPDLPGFDPASVGRAMSGVEIRILGVEAPHVDEPLPTGTTGQVAIRAASMLAGYLGTDDPPPLLDGFFLTGDLGHLDAHGNLVVTGRLKLLIDVGGLKVNPLEVEDVLAQHPGVGQCVVVPMRVSETVCRLKAVVTPSGRPGAAAPTSESLRQFARGRLVAYKVPRVFEVRDSLPKSPTGKVLRHLVDA